MGQMLEALRRLQTIEHEIAEVRRRLRSKGAAVAAQQARIDELKQQHRALHDQVLARQKQAGAVELELKAREAEVAKLRQGLNTARTNKEYSSILTQMNTIKADNSKLEDEALRIMQDVDRLKAEAEEVLKQVADAEGLLEQIKETSAGEIAALEGRLAELRAQRDEAARDVPSDALAVFNRIAETRDGDVMARIEVNGDKPPYEYICGGCFMSLTAEHVNALRTRDELRSCDCCGRILYIDADTAV